MPETTSASLPASTSLERISGGELRIESTTQITINRYIQAEKLSIQTAHFENALPDADARLFLFPIADGAYHIELLFLMNGTQPAMATVYKFHFQPAFFEMFEMEWLSSVSPFRLDQSAEYAFLPCAATKILLHQLENTLGINELLKAMQATEAAIQILRKSVEAVTLPFTVCAVPACRFLENETEQVKIYRARTILEETLDAPLTIKELSRKIAMNECYLKKGFKIIFSKTINEFQQELRISKAKELLMGGRQSVTNVAALLGYSSISHFSTAFKKSTGLKPCELLG